MNTKQFIITQAHKHRYLTTRPSQFYDEYCNYIGLSKYRYNHNRKLLRNDLNEMVKSGDLVSRYIGSGECGYSHYRYRSCKVYYLPIK